MRWLIDEIGLYLRPNAVLQLMIKSLCQNLSISKTHMGSVLPNQCKIHVQYSGTSENGLPLL